MSNIGKELQITANAMSELQNISETNQTLTRALLKDLSELDFFDPNSHLVRLQILGKGATGTIYRFKSHGYDIVAFFDQNDRKITVMSIEKDSPSSSKIALHKLLKDSYIHHNL